MTVPKGTGSKRDMSGLAGVGRGAPAAPEQAAGPESERGSILDPAALMDWIQGLFARRKN